MGEVEPVPCGAAVSGDDDRASRGKIDVAIATIDKLATAADAPPDRIIAHTPGENIVACTAVERIVACLAEQSVIAAQTGERVAAIAAVDDGVHAGCCDGVDVTCASSDDERFRVGGAGGVARADVERVRLVRGHRGCGRDHSGRADGKTYAASRQQCVDEAGAGIVIRRAQGRDWCA